MLQRQACLPVKQHIKSEKFLFSLTRVYIRLELIIIASQEKKIVYYSVVLSMVYRMYINSSEDTILRHETERKI